MDTLKHFNLSEFIKTTHTLKKELNITNFTRLHELYDNINGNLEFKITTSLNNKNKTTLELSFCGKMYASCQNCLEPVELRVNINSATPIFRSQTELSNALESCDAINDCDGIVTNADFDLFDFIEDEIITSLPIAPRHEFC